MTFICKESFHINSSNITGHQYTVTISELHETVHLKPKNLLCYTNIWSNWNYFVCWKFSQRLHRIPWEFPEFSMF